MTAPPAISRILAGVDGSDNGRRALVWAILFAQRANRPVLVVPPAAGP